MSKKKLQLKISTPFNTVFDEMVDQVTVRTTAGEITVLPDHIPLVSPMDTGEVMVKTDGAEQNIAVDGGVLEIRHDSKVFILSSRAEHAQDIDIERAEAALARAEETMKAGFDSIEVDHSNVTRMIARDMNRLRVAKKGRRK